MFKRELINEAIKLLYVVAHEMKKAIPNRIKKERQITPENHLNQNGFTNKTNMFGFDMCVTILATLPSHAY